MPTIVQIIEYGVSRDSQENGDTVSLEQLESKDIYSDGSEVMHYSLYNAGSYTESGTDGSVTVKTTVQVNFDDRVFEGVSCRRITGCIHGGRELIANLGLPKRVVQCRKDMVALLPAVIDGLEQREKIFL